MQYRTVKDRQSLFDFALQHCGDVQAVFEIAELNGLELTEPLTHGTVLQVPQPYNKAVVKYYQDNGIEPATGEAGEVVIIPTGSGVFFGAAPMPGVIGSSFIQSLPHKISAESHPASFSGNAGPDDYIWYCFPKSWGVPLFSFGGYEVSLQLYQVLNVDENGEQMEYYVCRSFQKNLGSTTIQILK